MISDLKKSQAKILLVDDERSIRVTLGEFLRNAGFEVETAKDADHALEMLSKDDFAVVVSDIIMPRITGVKLLEAIRQNSPFVQVILMTGEPTVETASEAVRAGAFDYLTKPIGKEDLIKTVTNAVRVKTLEDEGRRLTEENLRYQENLEMLVEERTQELQHTQKLYHKAEQLGKIGYWEWDHINDKLTACSEEFARIHGMTVDEALAYFSDTGSEESIVHPDDQARYRQFVLDAQEKRKGMSIEFKVILPSGLERYHHQVNEFALDEQGEILSWFGTVQDITERVQAKTALKKYAGQLETLNTVTTALSTSLELDRVLELILDQIGTVIPFDSGAIFLHEKEGLRVVVDQGFKISVLGKIFPDDDELFIDVKKSGEVLVLNHIKDDTRFQNWGQSEEVSSWMGIPLIARDSLIGFLTLDSFQANSYSSEHADLATSFAAQAAQAIENARQHNAAQRRGEQLTSLRKIDQAITGSFDLKITLEILLEHLLLQLEVDAAVILSYEKALQNLTFIQGRGFRTTALQHTSLRLGRGFAGKAALERRTIFISDLVQPGVGFSDSPNFEEEGFRAYYGLPLIAKGELVGVLEIFKRSPLNPDGEWEEFLHVLAEQAAIAIDNNALFLNLQRSNDELMVAYDATIKGWAMALELRDMETEGHSQRVVKTTLKLAEMLNIRNKDKLNIRRGALLHDIGKMGVPDAILQKPGKLTEEEWVIMRLHPVYAYDWLSTIEYLRPALDIPYYHHEKWDGTGYPVGMKAKQIPIAARIFAIVDVWDALRSDRPYRKAWSKEKTLAHIQEESGKHFDPEVVKAFLKYINSKNAIQ